ncbi:IclR family transcriptional regulator [Natrinema salifodinae]|uniref:Transcriptional regulator, IclR family n=2 Tax=Natrinema salifodinae TaxID=1202768 RepID=A0A1I0LYI4_9EURY|nr:IclR family transcriptional regulator [Natrinema salifodinae]SEV80524.1 transcriptional regulator, IclR family [Natrinema salifodinae]
MGKRTEGTIKSDETLLEILETLHSYERVSLTTIADEVGVSKSTVHRHLRTLQNRRFVTKIDDEYVLGLEFLRFGGAARERYSFHRQSKAIVQQVADQTGEFVGFLVEDQGIGTFLYCEMGTEGVPSEARVGQNLYLHQSASGKAVLAHLPADRREEILDEYDLPARTENTITDREELRSELAEIRDRGYATVHGEYVDGLKAVAAPAFDPDDALLGSLVVAGPSHRLRGDRFESELPDLIQGAVKEFELTISYT